MNENEKHSSSGIPLIYLKIILFFSSFSVSLDVVFFVAILTFSFIFLITLIPTTKTFRKIERKKKLIKK